MTGPTREDVERLIIGMDRGDRDEAAMSIGRKNQDGTFTVLSILHGSDADAVWHIATENAALRERLEAAEAELALVDKSPEYWHRRAKEAETALTEARAREAAAWEAAARVADHYAEMDYCAMGYPEDGGIAASGTADTIRRDIRALTPTDATAALTAVKDAEWDAAIEAAAFASGDGAGRAGLEIRSLRRNPTEGV